MACSAYISSVENHGPPAVSVSIDVEPWIVGQGLIPELRRRGYDVRPPGVAGGDICVVNRGTSSNGQITVEVTSTDEVRVTAFGNLSLHAVGSLHDLADLIDQFAGEVKIRKLGGDAL